MFYLGFFIFCLVIVAIASVSLEARKKALLFGCLCLGIAYLLELNGVQNHDWSYTNVNSVLQVTGIPIEILFGYFTAGFLMFIMIIYLPRVSTERRRREVMQFLFLGTGVLLLAHAYINRSMSILVGWSLIGIFGLSVARDRTIPLTVGMGAFLADWVVESMLTARVEYYTNGWDPTIGLVFMFAGMFISGVLTHRSLTAVNLPLLLERDGSMSAQRAEAIASEPRGPLQSILALVLPRKD